MRDRNYIDNALTTCDVYPAKLPGINPLTERRNGFQRNKFPTVSLCRHTMTQLQSDILLLKFISLSTYVKFC